MQLLVEDVSQAQTLQHNLTLAPVLLSRVVREGRVQGVHVAEQCATLWPKEIVNCTLEICLVLFQISFSLLNSDLIHLDPLLVSLSIMKQPRPSHPLHALQ